MIRVFEDKRERDDIGFRNNRPKGPQAEVGNLQTTEAHLFNGVWLTAERTRMIHLQCHFAAGFSLSNSANLSIATVFG
jgi:hypothetical protein